MNKLILIVTLIILVFTMIGAVSAADRDVGPGKTYSALNDAIGASDPGDNINVYDDNGAPYLHQENVEVNKANLTITSKGNVTITASDTNQPVFYVRETGNGSSINNFKIQGNEYTSVGIFIGSSKVTVENNEIFHFGTGIEIQLDSTEIKILKNHIFDNAKTESGAGIYLVGDIYTEISANTIENNNYGINSETNQYSKITGNTIKNNTGGIRQIGSSFSTITNNIFPNTILGGTAIELLLSYSCQITGNTIQNSGTGIIIEDEQSGFYGNNVIKSCSITNCNVGIEITDSSYNRIETSGIGSCDIGIAIRDTSVRNALANHNSVLFNTISNNDFYGILIENGNENKVLSNNIYNNENGIGFQNFGSTIYDVKDNRIAFNRIAYNNGKGLVNQASSIIDATLNWWGSNENPSNKIASGVGTKYDPWIVLKIYEGPTFALNEWRQIVADLTYTSQGWQINFQWSPDYSWVPNNVLAAFGTDHGTIGTPIYTDHGVARSTLSLPLSFSGTIYAGIMVDDQHLYIPIYVASKTQQYFNPKLFNSNYYKFIPLSIGVATQNITNNSNQSSGNSGSNSEGNAGGSSANTRTIILTIMTLIIIAGGGYWLFMRK